MFGSHDAIRAAVSLSRNDRDLGNRRLGKRKQQLCAVPHDPVMFLPDARQKARDILESNQRNIEAVAKTHESGGFYGGIDVQNTRKKSGLVGNDPDRISSQPGKTNHDVRREMLLYFEEISLI